MTRGYNGLKVGYYVVLGDYAELYLDDGNYWFWVVYIRTKHGKSEYKAVCEKFTAVGKYYQLKPSVCGWNSSLDKVMDRIRKDYFRRKKMYAGKVDMGCLRVRGKDGREVEVDEFDDYLEK